MANFRITWNNGNITHQASPAWDTVEQCAQALLGTPNWTGLVQFICIVPEEVLEGEAPPQEPPQEPPEAENLGLSLEPEPSADPELPSNVGQ